MSMAYDAIVAALLSLQPDQVEGILGRCKALRGTPSTSPVPPDQHWLFEAFLAELQSRGLSGDSRKVSSNKAYHAYTRNIDVTLIYFNQVVPNLKRVQRPLLSQTVARVLSSWLLRHKVPLSLTALCNNMSNIALALEDAFPGYLAAGCLGYVIKQPMQSRGGYDND